MNKTLSAGIAGRYLISKKSHSAVGVISAVSVCAMAVATAAIVCVLSVFNGFRNEIGGRLDRVSPDIILTPASGKVFADVDHIVADAKKMENVAMATPTLSDNALALYESREMPVLLKGVDMSDYSRVSELPSLLSEDEEWPLGSAATVPGGVISVGVASQLGAVPGASLLLFAPRRMGRVNMGNPSVNFITDSIEVAGVFRTDRQEYDENCIVVPIDVARRLLQYSGEASAVEISLRNPEDAEKTMSMLRKQFGNGVVVKDRARQHENDFRMVEIEKWISFLLLFFILAIASFNLISSLSMLVLEKESSISTLVSLGMSRRQIGRIFAWESVYVSALGGISGIVLGVLICMLQINFGLITIETGPGISIPYPVNLQWSDMIVTLVPVVAIGVVTAVITARYARAKALKA